MSDNASLKSNTELIVAEPHITKNIENVYKALQNPGMCWKICSAITLASVGIVSKIIMKYLNTTTCYNLKEFTDVVENRPKDVPLVTVANHQSCFDDPGLWGVLRFRQLCSYEKMRWTLAAHNICFTNRRHSYFFALGKTLPVVRGNGVYQECLDFCIRQLNLGQWVHIFPAGKVSLLRYFLRIKWGVGRMIYESQVTPIVIPIWHIGMDQVLPNSSPYIFHFNNHVLINFGKPINLTSEIEEMKRTRTSTEVAMKRITDIIQLELAKLKVQTEAKLASTACKCV